MKRWPWKRRTEKRAGYTDQIIQELQRRAATLSADPERTAAAQIAGGLWGRCLAVASVAPAAPITKCADAERAVLDRPRSLPDAVKRSGGSPRTATMAPRLWHVGEFDMTGDYDPASWTVPGHYRRAVTTLGADVDR